MKGKVIFMAISTGFDFDTVDSADVTPAAVATEKKAATTTNKKMNEFQKMGMEAQASMSADEQAIVKSKKDSLVFKGFAVLQSKMTESIARGKDAEGKVIRVKAPKTVGLVFNSKESIVVPLIDVKYGFKLAVPQTEISERTIPAGQDFILTKLEAMYLLARVEYSGYFTTEGNGDGYMNVNTAKYQTENALPTPTFNLIQGGSHDMTIPIDTTDASGNVVISGEPEAQRFAAFLVKKPAQRVGGSAAAKPKVDKPVVVTAALRQILNIK